MSDIKFSNRILRRFAETVALELGADQINGMLTLANLPGDWKNPDGIADEEIETTQRLAATIDQLPTMDRNLVDS